mmetsp:Transcript_97029/g.279233  ORF Transcript_97029/g.279233 Transcript_97029/m.279233 type:complete len:282 (+) Transcript_97029:3059-3904(+)
MASRLPARAASSNCLTCVPLLVVKGMLRAVAPRSSTLPISSSPALVVVLIQPVCHSEPTLARRLLCTPSSRMRTVVPGFSSVMTSLSRSSAARTVTIAFTSCIPPTSKSMVASLTSSLHFMTRGSLIFVLELIQPSVLPARCLPTETFILLPSPTSITSSVVPTCSSMTTSLSRLSSCRTVTGATVSHMSPGCKSNRAEQMESREDILAMLSPFFSTEAAAADARDILEDTLDIENLELLDVFVVADETLRRSGSWCFGTYSSSLNVPGSMVANRRAVCAR